MRVYSIVVSLACLVGVQCLNTKLTLPWGTWEASQLFEHKDIYKFQNVRFGAQPIRFGNSSYPEPIQNKSTIQDSTYGPSCIQIDVDDLDTPPGGRPDRGSPITVQPPDMAQSEDCLFLDIYVPKSVLDGRVKSVPVVVWLYGGAYAFGSKTPYGNKWPFYSGQSLIETSDNPWWPIGGEMIFVAGNYRMGAFGWLAGHYMEQAGLPNAGLYDQRLMLDFVRTYIARVGGNPQAVSAWGESAGAGSIMHHITAFKGQQDPLFKTALLQSPAFQWQWNRQPDGGLDAVYRTFSNLTGCGYTLNMSCLQSASLDSLVNANQDLFKTFHLRGLFPVGPALDGKWVDKLPAAQIAQGAYWKKLDSIMVSHVGNESGSFVPGAMQSCQDFDNFVNAFMPEPELIPLRNTIKQRYDCQKAPCNGNPKLCAGLLIRDSTFTCNTRQLYDAYKGKAYMMQYSFPAPYSDEAQHATDLLPTFVHKYTNISALLEKFVKPPPFFLELTASYIRHMHDQYVKYLGSYAMWGNPNTAREWGTPVWSFATDSGNLVQQVMKVKLGTLGPIPSGPYFEAISDSINTQQSCQFWTDAAVKVSGISKETVASKLALLAQNLEL